MQVSGRHQAAFPRFEDQDGVHVNADEPPLLSLWLGNNRNSNNKYIYIGCVGCSPARMRGWAASRGGGDVQAVEGAYTAAIWKLYGHHAAPSSERIANTGPETS